MALSAIMTGPGSTVGSEPAVRNPGPLPGGSHVVLVVLEPSGGSAVWVGWALALVPARVPWASESASE